MTDLLEPENDPGADDGGGVLTTVFDAIGLHFGHIPAIVRKNVAKAFTHLMKVPNAYIDGMAAEIKATSDARVAVTKATGKTLAKSIEVDRSLAAIATATNASRILRQQVNAAQVLQYAAGEVKLEDSTEVAAEPEEISEDWLNAFEREAVDMSSEHMQRLFGKILAGEIKRPKSYSIRTVRLMAQLDNHAAELFRLLCSMSCSFKAEPGDAFVDSRVLDLGHAAGQNGLLKFGLGFAALNTLFEYGLIISDYGSTMNYGGSIVLNNTIALPLEYANRRFGLLPKTIPTPEQMSAFRFTGVQLSQAGKELLGIVDLVENPAYTADLTNYLDTQGYALIGVVG